MNGLRSFDWTVLLIVAVLCSTGLALIYSVFHPPAGAEVFDVDYSYLKRQALWMGLGAVVLLFGFIVPFRVYETLAHAIYLLCIILLFVVLLMPSGGDTQRWIRIGGFGIQPSELMKVALILVYARTLSGHRRDPNKIRNMLLIIALSAVPFLLVLKQPDLGTALVFFGVLVPMLYWRGFKGLHILFILSPVVSGILVIGEKLTTNPWPFGVFIAMILVVAYLRRSNLIESVSLVVANLATGFIFPVLWGNFKAYQQMRVINFLNPEADRLGSGWQVIQSKIAIGSGGFGGKGYLLGTQKALEFLPAKHTDFIFSVVGEEAGLVGAVAVLVLFSVLVLKALSIAQKAKSEFASALCVGIAAYFFFQVIVNVAMTVGMAPVTGIPLPFLSYGGSSMLVSCFLIGLLLNVSARWYEY